MGSCFSENRTTTTVSINDAFEYKQGCNISTLTIEQSQMTIAQAKIHAQTLPNCIAFCIENNEQISDDKRYECYFKKGNPSNDIQSEPNWHTYLCPQTQPISKDENAPSKYQLPRQIAYDKPNTKSLTYDTKRAMAWAHFLAHIWDRHINKTHKCEFLSENETMGDILQHVVIFGGGPRDYILGQEFDDIDMFLNTRELNKLHLLHLRACHSTAEGQSESVKCCLWKLYQNKFKKSTSPRGNKNIPLNFELNATFFAQILFDSAELKNKLSVTNYRVGDNIVFMMRLLDDVQYYEYNLKGQDLDLADTFKLELDDRFKIKKEKKLYHQRSTLLFKADKQKFLRQSQTLHDAGEIKEESRNELQLGDSEHSNPFLQKDNKLMHSMYVSHDFQIQTALTGLEEISLPIHETKSRERFTSNDFSINILVVFLNEFYELSSDGIDGIRYEWNVYGSVDTSHLNDGLQDLHNKLLRAPMFDPTYTIKVHYSPKRGSAHFWRCVKFVARYGAEWSIDPKLKAETIKFNREWLNEERFTTPLFYETFVFLMLEKYVKCAGDHPKRFKAMHDLEMHTWVIPFFKERTEFRECLLAKMNSFSDEYTAVIEGELKKYGYM